MSEHEGAEILRLDISTRTLLDVLSIYAKKSKKNIPDILIIEIGLPGYIVEDIFNHKEISEEHRKLIDEWIKHERVMHIDMFSSYKNELAAHRMGKSATASGVRVQSIPDNPSDMFGGLGNFFEVGPEDVHQDDGPIDFFDDDY